MKIFYIQTPVNSCTSRLGLKVVFLLFTGFCFYCDEGFEMSYDEGNGEILEVGKEMEVFFAEHYSVDKHIRNTQKNTNLRTQLK